MRKENRGNNEHRRVGGQRETNREGGAGEKGKEMGGGDVSGAEKTDGSKMTQIGKR